MRGAILLGVSAYDQPRRGGAGRTVAAVLLALAVLAVLGGVFGYLLGNRAKNIGGGPPESTDTTDAAVPCPDFIEGAAQAKGAKTPMTLRLYMTTSRSEVWICAAAGGGLWYQGHSIKQSRYPKEVPVEGVNGLLLSGVNGIDQGGSRAVNRDPNGVTTYTVYKDQLVIERNGKKSTERAVNP